MADRFDTFDWNDLRFFLTVARCGSLRGGAQKIGANHATVSRRLAALEDAIGARLFDRTREGLRLTQCGEELLPYAGRVEEEVAAASRVVAGSDADPSGSIYVSMAPFMAVTSLMDDMSEFGRRFERIDLHLQVTNSFVDLARREADVSLRMAFEVKEEDVVGRRLLTCAKCAYCSPGYAAGMQDNGGRDLHWIGWSDPERHASSTWIRKGPYPHATLRHRVNEAVPQMTLAAAGAGLSYLPCFMGDRHPGLVRAPFQEPVMDRSLWLLLHGDLRNTARIRAFVDFLVERILSRREEFTDGL